MTDRSWIFPAILFTALNSTLALLLYPKPESLLITLKLLPLMVLGAAGGLCVIVFVKTLRLMRAGKDNPLRILFEWADWKFVRYMLLAIALAALNKIAFLWLKPTLNIHVAFWADPLLADVDKAIFFGGDPWRLLSWINNDLSGFVYHPVWYFTMIGALMVALAQPASTRKSAMLLSYFGLWSVVGPLIHILLPAGGPIFYERLGYGDRFATINGGPETVAAADFLWRGFTSGQFDTASGISAMPSLHVTMAVWTMMCIWQFRRSWFLPVAASSMYVSALSVSLGWHYALDGIVGGGCALLLYYVLLIVMEWRYRPTAFTKLGNPTAMKGENIIPQ